MNLEAVPLDASVVQDPFRPNSRPGRRRLAPGDNLSAGPIRGRAAGLLACELLKQAAAELRSCQCPGLHLHIPLSPPPFSHPGITSHTGNPPDFDLSRQCTT